MQIFYNPVNAVSRWVCTCYDGHSYLWSLEFTTPRGLVHIVYVINCDILILWVVPTDKDRKTANRLVISSQMTPLDD